MKVFAVYVKPKAAAPIETATFVQEGFSLAAFVLNMFWMLYHRIWWVAALVFLFNSAVSYAQIHHFISQDAALVLNISILAVIGFEASDWYQDTLKRRGYILLDIVTGRNLEQAQQRFFDYYVTQATAQSTVINK